MDEQNAIRILHPFFWKLGKSSGEQLWMHQYTVWRVFRTLYDASAFPPLDDELLACTELACLLHDIKKAAPWNQVVLTGDGDVQAAAEALEAFWSGRDPQPTAAEMKRSRKLLSRGRTDHQMETQADFQAFLLPSLRRLDAAELLPFTLTDERARTVFDIAKHHFLEERDIAEATQPAFGHELKMLKWCDRLASMERIDADLLAEIRRVNALGKKLFDLTYFTISRPFCPSTALMMKQIVPAYLDLGWEILLQLEGAALFVHRGAGELPDKSDLVERCHTAYQVEAFRAQEPQYGTKTLFTGTAADHPATFLLAHRAAVEARLDGESGGLTFLKIAGELLNMGGWNTDDYPFAQIAFGLTTGVRGISAAAAKWEKQTNASLPQKEDGKTDKRAAAEKIFEQLTVGQLVPEEVRPKALSPGRALCKLKSRELFDLLRAVASAAESPCERDKQVASLFGEILAVEEEIDFASIAQRRFQAYRDYKLSPQSQAVGACDICGATVTQKPGADFARGEIQAFFQTKARPDVPRKVCPLCAYDNSVLRAGSGKWTPIFLRASARVPVEFRTEFRQLVSSVQAGLRQLQDLEDLQEKWGMLFPRDVRVPLGKPRDEADVVISTHEDLDLLVRLTAEDPKAFSPKDQAAKFEPLYHLLNLLGFRVSLGTEQQTGLFGTAPLSTEGNYMWSLAVVLLSPAVRSKRSYVGAQQLLRDAPSVALRLVSEEQKGRDGRSYMPIHPERMPMFFRLLAGADPRIAKNGDDYTMKDLFQDAALFAEGIPKFCFAQDDWKNWNSATGKTKHLATKPLSQALNTMLMESDFEVVFAKFLDDIRSNIARDKETPRDDPDKQPTTDESELAVFAGQARTSLEKYHQMKERDLAEFIRAKNALLSTTWIFARYPKVREEIAK